VPASYSEPWTYDGDGIADVLVGASFENPGEGPIRAGHAYVFSGAATIVANEPPSELSTSPALHAAYPNPFNPSTTLPYDVPQAENIRLAVLDVLGREIIQLVNRQHAPGSHEVVFEAGSLPNGVYLARLEAGGKEQTRRLTLLR